MTYRALGQAASTCPAPSQRSTMTYPMKLVASWGAWPDTSCPQWLYTGNPTSTLSTTDALISLKYQVVGFSALAFAVGLGVGVHYGRRRS